MRTQLTVLLFWALSPFAQAATGQIQVLAEGAPGEIILDNFPTGKKAPGLLEGVSEGEHEISLKYGCMSGTLRVKVAGDAVVEAKLPMNNSGGVGTVRFSALPPNAEVWVDDAPVVFKDGTAELPCGAHRVLVEAPGIAPWQELVVVTTGKWTRVQARFDSNQAERVDSGSGGGVEQDPYLGAVVEEGAEDFSFDPRSSGGSVDFEDEFEEGKRDSDFAPRTPDELSDLDPGWNRRSSNPLSSTRRVGISVGMAGVGLAGSVFMIQGVLENNAFVEEWKKLYKYEPTSAEAQAYWNRNIRPARTKAGLGGVVMGVGLGGATVTMMFLEVQPGAGMIRMVGDF